MEERREEEGGSEWERKERIEGGVRAQRDGEERWLKERWRREMAERRGGWRGKVRRRRVAKRGGGAREQTDRGTLKERLQRGDAGWGGGVGEEETDIHSKIHITTTFRQT